MGKCVKNIALSVIVAAMSIFTLSAPVFATPNTNTNTEPNTSVTTKPEETTPNTTTPENTENTEKTDDTTTENSSNSNTSTQTENVSCYDQVGNLGWIICPGAGLFGNIIDGAYNLLVSIIEVNPLPNDNSSPVYIVWEYFRNITNLLFVVFFLVVIFSQITGIGINNYGIKRILPRIIITAILVNLSYIVCTLAVDLSNILGNGFQGFFTNIQNIAIQNGSISDAASSTSVSGIVAAMLGIGTAAGATFIAATVLGGVSGIIWVLLPVLLGGLIAVISAVVTMAARQALIFILIMISPLAFIAYLLPNTERWFSKWYNMLARMLFFYPLFSILYGASQLAGLVIITSATNWLGVVLGIAVKILPLFMSIPLMRMSGSILGKVDGVVRRIGSPAHAAVIRTSAERRGLAKQKQLSKARPLSQSARLAQYLERQRARREFDAKEMASINADNNQTYAMSSWRRRNGNISRRGFQHLENEQTKMQNAAIRLNIENDFDEGFKDNVKDAPVRNERERRRLKAINEKYDQLIIDNHTAESRKRVVTHNNMKHRAELIHENVEKQGNAVHNRVLESFNLNVDKYEAYAAKETAYNAAIAKQQRGETLTAADQAAIASGPLRGYAKAYYNSGRQAINFTLADAISARRKLDKEASGVYFDLYDDSPAGTIPGDALTASLDNGDYNSMSAAIAVMAKRGDHKDVMEILYDNSDKIAGNGQDKVRFQKELNDACLALKPDNQVLWAWAKSNMIRRGKYNHEEAEGKDHKLAAYIDLSHFLNGSLTDGDVMPSSFDANGNPVFDNQADADNYAMISMNSILTNVRDGKIFAGADRTMYKYFVKAAKNGKINANNYLFTDIKHLRASACSGMMDGEQLAELNSYLSFGYDGRNKNTDPAKYQEDNKFFFENRTQAEKMITKYFTDMTATQIASMKTATLMQLNDAMLALKDDGVSKGGKTISNTIYMALENEIKHNLMRGNMTQARAGMNKTVREMLGIPL